MDLVLFQTVPETTGFLPEFIMYFDTKAHCMQENTFEYFDDLNSVSVHICNNDAVLILNEKSGPLRC